jgi:lipoprotein-releasing system ATP-binding protein
MVEPQIHDSESGNIDELKNASAPLIVVRDISKSFTSNDVRVDVLSGVDLDLAPAETMAIVGASGIGKSTFLHILGVLDRPDSGTLLFNGTNVLDLPDAQLAGFRNETVGFVFQFHHLLPEFSAIENTMMPALIKGALNTEARSLAEQILVRVGLKDRLNHRVTKLSGGEQQRVALARALVLKPLVLLADEPTGNLDRKNSEEAHRLMLELNAEMGMSIVVVTHSVELANQMFRRMTIVNGKLTETN